MRFLFSLLLFLALCQQSIGQTQKIPEADIQFSLPNNKWYLTSVKNTTVPVIYTYKRDEIKDKAGRTIIPNIAFIIQDLPDSIDLVNYSLMNRQKLSFEVDEVFDCISHPEMICHKNALGFKAHYESNHLRHNIYYLNIIHAHKGIQVVMDITADLFEEYKSEFQKAILSIANIHNNTSDGHMTEETIKLR